MPNETLIASYVDSELFKLIPSDILYETRAYWAVLGSAKVEYGSTGLWWERAEAEAPVVGVVINSPVVSKLSYLDAHQALLEFLQKLLGAVFISDNFSLDGINVLFARFFVPFINAYITPTMRDKSAEYTVQAYIQQKGCKMFGFTEPQLKEGSGPGTGWTAQSTYGLTKYLVRADWDSQTSRIPWARKRLAHSFDKSSCGAAMREFCRAANHVGI